ncbi:hypothetical protein QWZ13_10325 [Reinekea marina]|uniref:DUF115 domain-containing protein n=1 Tax=Reinekea marina TaxID=1310421 RepID=A0ABV7WST0_9GAMM|nr:hypothetical protein [Reinekea marina]MDN3649309.1 hypothetical protein [Reinekea marina]
MMSKALLKKIYIKFPFGFKVYVKDLIVFCIASLRGAKNIKRILFVKDHPEVCVLGNGPSLKKDMLTISKRIGTHDFICVNNFCDDDLYIVLKPKVYVLLDAYFFSENSHEDWIVRREKTFTIINDRTDWAMNIVVPHNANVSIIKEVIKNENVNIIKVNTQNYFGNTLTGLAKRLFDIGFYGPPQINVLIYAIYLPIIAKYKAIYVYGADLSFHNDVEVDQESNELFITFKHFNEENKVEKLTKNPEKIHKWRMGELLELSANTFYAHEVIRDYAKTKDIAIYNGSDYSLIDAYPRKK